MMQYLLVFYFSIVIIQTNTDYQYNDFSRSLNRLKNQYSVELRIETDKDELLKKAWSISSDTHTLKREIEEYIKKNISEKNSKFDDLLWETKEFQRLVHCIYSSLPAKLEKEKKSQPLVSQPQV